ncbi:hypothetical protein POM88_018945 [Heracleum sosnowskyi]|uniref:Piwi domain-containing protein n=1 Tax=Heracleum sosnowskyi TaxID=360622 RepID=A0AAD8MZU1_9APIA|nr:hypothetical protein POM88_018945 [Heracleum sosnowskyi]
MPEANDTTQQLMMDVDLLEATKLGNVSSLKNRVNITSGTPSRIKKLIYMEVLGLSWLQVIVLDMHTDVKGYSLLSLPQIRDEFWELYKCYFHQKVVEGDLRICLYGPIPIIYKGKKNIIDFTSSWGDCILLGKDGLEKCAPTRVNDQYLTNVLLKINAKLGGLNSKLSIEASPSIPLVSKDPTIILGMDVSHGSPGQSDRCSIYYCGG